MKTSRTFVAFELRRTVSLLLLGGMCSTAVLASSTTSIFSPERAAFSLRFQGEISPYRITSAFVLPGESLVLEALDEQAANRYSLHSPLGEGRALGPRKWRWKAPSRKGTYSLRVARQDSDESIHLTVFVMVPASEQKGDHLNGYRIGRYPTRPLKGLAAYKPPRGFIEVTRENEDTLLAPHFRLKQFLCKQEGDYPKYLVLQGRLLQKLEVLLEQMNLKGHRSNSLYVMSGYRTPYYNRMIGNGTYSRHVWGGAADVFLDESPADDFMDDLNHDGTVDDLDAMILRDIIEEIDSSSILRRLLGGLAIYPQNRAHGPFVHMDERGFRARW